MKRALFLALLLALFAGCEEHETYPRRSPSPTPTPDVLAEALDPDADPEDSTELRLNIRNFVIDFLKTNHPDWQLHGISMARYTGDSEYDIRADINIGSGSKAVRLRAWYFIPENGKGYWKIVEE